LFKRAGNNSEAVHGDGVFALTDGLAHIASVGRRLDT